MLRSAGVAPSISLNKLSQYKCPMIDFMCRCNYLHQRGRFGDCHWLSASQINQKVMNPFYWNFYWKFLEFVNGPRNRLNFDDGLDFGGILTLSQPKKSMAQYVGKWAAWWRSVFCVLLYFISMSSMFVHVTNSRGVLVVVKVLYILS